MMDLGDACPQLLARCDYVPYTLGEFAAKAHAYVRELQRLHPLFSDLRLVGKSAKDSPPLLSDLSNLEAWILERGWDLKASVQAAYSDLDANGKATAQSRGRLGFGFSLSNLKGWDAKVDIGVHTGISSHIGLCEFVLPRKDHPEFQQQPLMGDLLELVVKHWPVGYASVASKGLLHAVNRKDDVPGEERIRKIEIGWLTYVRDASFAQALPPQVQARPLGPGVVFQLTEHFSSYENPDDVALGKRVRDTLAAAGRLRADSIKA